MGGQEDNILRSSGARVGVAEGGVEWSARGRQAGWVLQPKKRLAVHRGRGPEATVAFGSNWGALMCTGAPSFLPAFAPWAGRAEGQQAGSGF